VSEAVEREQRLAELLGTEGPALRRLAGAYEADPARREDLLQEIALALWQALPSFRGEASLRTFAFRIAHNQGLRHAARAVRRRHVTIDEAGEIADGRPGPLSEAEGRERAARLQAAVRELPLLLREALVLRLEGLATREIAEILGTSENGVSIRLSRARAALRARLGEEVEHARR
jgi:RNA polymerase sigma factor (sigma-70 family)